MKKVQESIRALIAATLVIVCIVNFWLALGVIGVLCISALLQWVLQFGNDDSE